MIQAQPLDIQGQGLYSSYSYNYPMDFQKQLLEFSKPFDLDSASEQVVGNPLNHGAKKLYKNKEWLKQKYINEKLSIREIGRKYDSNKTTIKRYLIKFNIPIRPLSQAKKIIVNCDYCENKLIRSPCFVRKTNFCNHRCFGYWLKINSKGEHNPFYGKHHTKETKNRSSLIITELFKNNKIKKPMLGKNFTKEHRLKLSISTKKRFENPIERYKISSNTERNKKIGIANKGKKISFKSRKKQSKTMKRLFAEGKIKPIPTRFKKGDMRLSGENNHSWKGGISFEPYGMEFNDCLKKEIRTRDNNICQLCRNKQESIKLSVHHIDYNKKNNNPNNLMSLCLLCHLSTNENRQGWTNYFQNIAGIKLMFGFP